MKFKKKKNILKLKDSHFFSQRGKVTLSSLLLDRNAHNWTYPPWEMLEKVKATCLKASFSPHYPLKGKEPRVK